jgi:hypothetical protein
MKAALIRNNLPRNGALPLSPPFGVAFVEPLYLALVRPRIRCDLLACANFCRPSRAGLPNCHALAISPRFGAGPSL